MSQLSFKDIEIAEKQAKVKEITAELDRRYKAIAFMHSRTEIAAINNISYSYLSEFLNTNKESKQHLWRAEMIPSLILENPDKFAELVINYLCDLTKRNHPEKKIPLTEKEQLMLIRKKIKEHGLEKLFEE